MMKNILRSIWEDIKARRNIELYISILLALTVAILNIFPIEFIQNQAVPSATLAILAFVAFGLLQDRRRNHIPITISSNNNINMDYVCNYIAENNISRARMIQYSGDMVRRAVEKLLERGATVELLIQHPSKAPNQFQIEKIASFQHLTKYDFKNSQNLIIRYYKETASLKGIKLDNSFLSMGWYIYRNKSKSENIPWLYGHNNATVSVRLNSPEVRDLVTTFDETFQALWETAEPYSENIEATINQILRQNTKVRK